MDNKSFRDYATRVSFNMSLSRNQSFCLWACATNTYLGRQHLDFGIATDMFIPGVKWLISHGFVTWDVTRSPVYQLTDAGEHTLALLRIAGIVPILSEKEKAA